MSKVPSPKLALAAPETIALDKLDIHEDNVRKSDIDETAIADLAADIAARGLLQSLSVRPVLDDEGAETGIYGIQAGSRRFRALKLLVKQKKLGKNTPVPCIVKRDGFAEADSLAENTQRQALKPLDEFRAFKAMADKGHGEDTIAAAFRVSTLVVRQRMRLANASPVVLKAHEEDELTLEQLMAFCLVDDHKRQEEVFAAVKTHWNNGPESIRRMLTEKSVRADDRRALFIGAEAYKAAGGIILRDLFDEEEAGWLQDVPLLEKMIAEQLAAEAANIKAEGWGWIETAVDFPWNHLRNYAALKPLSPARTDAEEAELEELIAELEEFEETPFEELTATAKKRLEKVKQLIRHLESFSPTFDEAQKAKAGAFVSLNDDGGLCIERGYVRREDMAAVPRVASEAADASDTDSDSAVFENAPSFHTDPTLSPDQDDDDDCALPDRLMIELTAHHSLALREALANNPDIAKVSALHAMALRLFYLDVSDSCLQVEVKDALTSPFPGLADAKAAKAIEARHRAWQEALPEKSEDLWHALLSLDADNRDILFAHCVGLTVNAVYEPWRRGDDKRRHAHQLAEALQLDMTRAGWVTRAENYLNRVTKAQIIEAVREAKGEKTAELLVDLKKKDMALEAERLLDGTGWLPEPLRTPAALDDASEQALPAFLDEAELQAAE